MADSKFYHIPISINPELYIQGYTPENSNERVQFCDNDETVKALINNMSLSIPVGERGVGKAGTQMVCYPTIKANYLVTVSEDALDEMPTIESKLGTIKSGCITDAQTIIATYQFNDILNGNVSIQGFDANNAFHETNRDYVQKCIDGLQALQAAIDRSSDESRERVNLRDPEHINALKSVFGASNLLTDEPLDETMVYEQKYIRYLSEHAPIDTLTKTIIFHGAFHDNLNTLADIEANEPEMVRAAHAMEMVASKMAYQAKCEDNIQEAELFEAIAQSTQQDARELLTVEDLDR